MPTKRWVVIFVLASCLPGLAVAEINKCDIDGKLVFQDRPCPSTETVGEHRERMARNELLHRKLDQMQAQGVGLVQRSAPKPPPPPKTEDDGRFVPIPRGEYRARQKANDARLQKETERRNAESAARFAQFIEQIQKDCGVEKLIEVPVVGMSDKTFRECTKLARFGRVTQIVVSENDGVPLRLYVYLSKNISRVYSIDGVITAVKP